MSQVIPESTATDDDMILTERPDGFYWRSPSEQREYGPFKSVAAATDFLDARGDAEGGPGESLAEAEAEIGMADWIDEETGEPAEEGIPRLEQH